MSIADKLTTIAENVPKVYDSGYNKAEKDFWDAYQNEGKKTDLTRMFGSSAWTNENFKPRYDLKPTNAYGMFWGSKINGDLVEILDGLGITLDFSNLSNYEQYAITNAFSVTSFTRIGVCDFRNFKDSAMQIGQVFMQSTNLVTIDKIIVNGHGFSSQAFKYCYKLKNLTIEGTIGRNSDFSCGNTVGQSVGGLTEESLLSIIGALADYSESGTTYTLTLGSRNLKNLTDVQKAIATEKGWTLA